MPSVKFLDHVIGTHEISAYPKKISAIKNWKVLTNISKLRGYLGNKFFYCRFFKSFRKIALPFTQMLDANKRFYCLD